MDANLFLNQTPDVLALCKTTLDYSIDSGNFSVKGCLPLIQKDSATHMDGLAIYMKEVLPPRKLSGFLFMFLAGVTSFSVLLSFPLMITFVFLYIQFLMLYHLTQMRFSGLSSSKEKNA